MPSPEEPRQGIASSSNPSTDSGRLPQVDLNEFQRASSTSLNPQKFIDNSLSKIPNEDLEKIARAMVGSHKYLGDEARELLNNTFTNPAVLGGMVVAGALLAFPPTTGPTTILLGALGVGVIVNQALKGSQLAMEGEHEKASKEFAEMFASLATTLGPTLIGKLGGLAKIGNKVPGLKNIFNSGKGSKGSVSVQLPDGTWQRVVPASTVSNSSNNIIQKTTKIGSKVGPIKLASQEVTQTPSEKTDQSIDTPKAVSKPDPGSGPSTTTSNLNASNLPKNEPSNAVKPESPSTLNSINTDTNREVLQRLSDHLIKARSGERTSYIGSQRLTTDEESNKWIKAALNEWLNAQGKTTNLLDINDGKLTPETIAAIKQFQKAHTFSYEENGKEVTKALAADGIVGPRTMQALQRFLESRSITYSENGPLTARELTGALAKEKGQTSKSGTTSTQKPDTNTTTSTQEFTSKTATVLKSALESNETSTLLADAQIRTGQGSQPLADSLDPDELAKHAASSDSTQHNLMIILKEEPDASVANWQKLIQMFEEAGLKVNQDGKELTVSL